MTDYHILMGGDEVALTRFFKDLHGGIYPLYFRGNIAKPRGKFVRVDYDFACHPKSSLHRLRRIRPVLPSPSRRRVKVQFQ